MACVFFFIKSLVDGHNLHSSVFGLGSDLEGQLVIVAVRDLRLVVGAFWIIIGSVFWFYEVFVQFSFSDFTVLTRTLGVCFILLGMSVIGLGEASCAVVSPKSVSINAVDQGLNAK